MICLQVRGEGVNSGIQRHFKHLSTTFKLTHVMDGSVHEMV